MPLLLLALLFSLKILFSVNTEFYGIDSQIHQFLAEMIARGVPLSEVPISHAIPAALAAPLLAMKLAGSPSVDGLLHLGNLISSLYWCLTIAAVFLLGRRLISREAGIVAAALYALHPAAYLFTATGEPYSGYALFLTCFFAALLHHAETRSRRSALLLGAMLVLCTLGRKEGVLVFAVLPFAAAFLPGPAGWRGRIRFAAWPAAVGLLLLLPWFLFLYQATGVILHRQVTDILMMRAGTDSMSYVVEREAAFAAGPHAWFHYAANLAAYLFAFLRNDVVNWGPIAILLPAGIAAALRDRRFWPMLLYMALHTGADLVFHAQVESDQAKDVALQFIRYDATRYQIAWAPLQALMIAACVPWLQQELRALWRQRASGLKLLRRPRAVIAAAGGLAAVAGIAYNALLVATNQYGLIVHGRYDDVAHPIKSWSAPCVAERPLLSLLKTLREREVRGATVALITPFTSSTDQIILEAFGGPQRYLSCSYGDYQWINGNSVYVPGGELFWSDLYAIGVARDAEGRPYACHRLGEPETLAALGVEYALLDRPFARVLPEVAHALKGWERVAGNGMTELMRRPRETAPTASMRRADATPPPAPIEPVLRGRKIGLNPVVLAGATAAIAAGDEVSLLSPGQEPWSRLFMQDLFLHAFRQGGNFTCYGKCGVRFRFEAAGERALHVTALRPPAAALSVALRGETEAAGFQNGALRLYDAAAERVLMLGNTGQPAAIVRQLDDDRIWFLTLRGESAVLSRSADALLTLTPWESAPVLSPHAISGQAIAFCDRGEFVEREIPGGGELQRLRLDAACYDVVSDESGGYFLSTDAGVFSAQQGRLEPIGPQRRATRLAYDLTSGRLGGGSLDGGFTEWDADGRTLQRVQLADAILAAPTFDNGTWHVITERGDYYRIAAAK